MGKIKTGIMSVFIFCFQEFVFHLLKLQPFQNPNFEKTPKAPSKINPKIPNWLDSIILRAIEPNVDRRYTHYSEMLYELNNPNKVKPFFSKESSIFERNPLRVCKIAFIISLIANFLILAYFLK